MQVVYAHCAGLDVHKKTVSACISVCEGKHTKQQQTRAFGTFTQDLLKLADWLKEQVSHQSAKGYEESTSRDTGIAMIGSLLPPNEETRRDWAHYEQSEARGHHQAEVS
jgi:hypothetical protein